MVMVLIACWIFIHIHRNNKAPCFYQKFIYQYCSIIAVNIPLKRLYSECVVASATKTRPRGWRNRSNFITSICWWKLSRNTDPVTSSSRRGRPTSRPRSRRGHQGPWTSKSSRPLWLKCSKLMSMKNTWKNYSLRYQQGSCIYLTVIFLMYIYVICYINTWGN